MTTKSETAAPAASTSSKPASSSKATKSAKPNGTKSKAKVDPAAHFEQLLRDQWAASLRSLSTDVKRGGDFSDVAKQLGRLAEALKEAGRVSA